MRHQADHVARLVADAGDVARRAIRVAPGIPGDHPATRAELGQCGRPGHVPALAALQHHGDLLALGILAGPRRSGVLDPEPDVLADEPEPAVAGQRAGQQVRLAQDLEAVADAKHGQARAGGGH